MDFRNVKVFAPCDFCGRRDYVKYVQRDRAICTRCLASCKHAPPVAPNPQIEEHW